jgi:hypothetical protein
LKARRLFESFPQSTEFSSIYLKNAFRQQMEGIFLHHQNLQIGNIVILTLPMAKAGGFSGKHRIRCLAPEGPARACSTP